MRRLWLLVIVCIGLLAAPAWADSTAIIEGTVTDARTGKAIPDVQVTAVSASGDVSSRTDSKGFYMLWDVPPGPTIVAFQREGFMLEEHLMCVYPGLTRTISTHMHEHTGQGYVLMSSLMHSPILEQTTSTHYLGPC